MSPCLALPPRRPKATWKKLKTENLFCTISAPLMKQSYASTHQTPSKWIKPNQGGSSPRAKWGTGEVSSLAELKITSLTKEIEPALKFFPKVCPQTGNESPSEITEITGQGLEIFTNRS